MTTLKTAAATTTTTTTTKVYTLAPDGIGPVDVTMTERGQGRPFLLLHGGAGPQSVADFASLLADEEQARVLTPTHPGFGGTPRPDGLTTVAGLAAVYGELLRQLDLRDVTVVGNSVGGWIAAEMGLLGTPAVGAIVLVGAVGIVVPDHPVADFFSLTLAEVTELSYHDPDSFRIDPDAMPPAQRDAMAGNRAALAVYAGTSMGDSTLGARLAAMHVPALVLSGESDRIVDAEYGRAYAAAIPGARFELLEATGHLPQIETPRRLLGSIADFAR